MGMVGMGKYQIRMKIENHWSISWENPAGEVTCVFLHRCSLGLTAPYLSDDDEKTLLTAECYRPSWAAPSFISSSDLHPLLADRKAEQRAASIPTWLPGRQLGSAISHHKPFWDILICGITGGYCFGDISIVLSWIKMKTPENWVQHVGTCLFCLLRNYYFSNICRVNTPLVFTFSMQDIVFPLTISVSSLQ